MSLLDFIELWIESLKSFLASKNVSVRIVRTDDERPNQSCAVTLERDDTEIDFITWESGHAELAITRTRGSSSEEHLDDLNSKKALSAVLARILKEIL
jgi:tRNA G10  N-methylase Trm11